MSTHDDFRLDEEMDCNLSDADGWCYTHKSDKCWREQLKAYPTQQKRSVVNRHGRALRTLRARAGD